MGTKFELPQGMRTQRPSIDHLLRTDLAKSSECRPIFGMLALVLFLPLLLAACGQQGGSTTKNYYGTQMSGGGSTKDPGDGTGGSTGDGGGGQGVQCEDGNLYVRDVYEAIFEKSRTMKSISGENSPDHVSAQARQVLIESLKSYFGPSSEIFPYVKDNYWIDLEKRISFIDDDRELLASQDANSPIKLKAGCKIVQIAYWDESPRNVKDDRLYVSRKLWKKLDQLNKVALLSHEVFFKQARIAGYTNSDAVRDQIGQLLSAEGLDTLFPDWIPSADPKVSAVLPASTTGFKVCDGRSEEDLTARLRLYQYEGKDGVQRFSIPLLHSSKINAALLQGAKTSFSPDDDVLLVATTDLLIFQSDLNGMEINHFNTTTLNRWYSDSGLLMKNLSLTDLFKSLPNRKTLWSETFHSSSEPITISMENTLLNWDGSKTPKRLSANGLIKEVNLELKGTLQRCLPLVDRAEGAIALLHKEIKSAMEQGKYPSNFPAWTAALKKLNVAGEARASECSALLKNTRVTYDLPAFLYSIYGKTNTVADAWRLLGEYSLEPRSYAPVTLGVVSVSQGTDELKFKMKCEDYKSQYLRTATAGVERDNKLVLGKQVTNDFKPSSFAEKTSDEQFVIQRLHTFLSQNESAAALQSFEDIGKYLGRGQAIESMYKLDAYYFIWELFPEKNVTLSGCDQNIEIYRAEKAKGYLGNACVLVTMGTTKNSYTVYFTYYSPEVGNPDALVPAIEYIRFAPPRPSPAVGETPVLRN